MPNRQMLATVLPGEYSCDLPIWSLPLEQCVYQFFGGTNRERCFTFSRLPRISWNRSFNARLRLSLEAAEPRNLRTEHGPNNDPENCRTRAERRHSLRAGPNISRRLRDGVFVMLPVQRTAKLSVLGRCSARVSRTFAERPLDRNLTIAEQKAEQLSNARRPLGAFPCRLALLRENSAG